MGDRHYGGGGFDLNASQGSLASWAGRPSERERKVWQRGLFQRRGSQRGARGRRQRPVGGGRGKGSRHSPPPREALPFS